ncbi:uncharacterized protein [Periplaneta americana]|uniref:uncharacterized protein n=1 Tax=Periplaneta americana TaxID=6978 RepID=UPI0037E96267
MAYEPSQMKRNKETLLLEHVDTVVKLLNSFAMRNNIKSQDVLRRLEYLYDRLTDFLDRESSDDLGRDSMSLESSSTSQESSPWQTNFDDQSVEAVATKKKSTESPANCVETTGGIRYNCDVCKTPVVSYNMDPDLSVALHLQEDAHRKAMLLLERKAMKEEPSLVSVQGVSNTREVNSEDNAVMNKAAEMSLGEESNQNGNWNYILVIDNRYHCRLCNVAMNGAESVENHIKESSHNKMTAVQTKSSQEIVSIEGVYKCTLCNVLLGSSSNAFQHKLGKAHLHKLANKSQELSKEDKFWLKIPEGFRYHKLFFSSVGDSVLQCKACTADVPKTHFNVLSHIRGKSHTRALANDIFT